MSRRSREAEIELAKFSAAREEETVVGGVRGWEGRVERRRERVEWERVMMAWWSGEWA